MREIKFRGMDIKGDWYYGNLSILTQRVNNVEAGTYISNRVGLPFAYEIRPETAGLYTGLKDKNGKEIYEGDICRCIHSEQNGKNPFEKIEQVYTRPGGFSLFGKPMQDFSYESNNRLTAFNWKTDRSINIPEFYYKIYDIEVIGNIWEHPTLLAEKGGENEAK